MKTETIGYAFKIQKIEESKTDKSDKTDINTNK